MNSAPPPRPAQIMNREDGGIISLRSPFGDSLDIPCNEQVTLLQLRHEVHERLGLAAAAGPYMTFRQDDAVLTEESAIDVEKPVVFTYPLRGGAGFSTVTAIPDALRCHVLCVKCGCQNVGDLNNSDWCVNNYCCLFQKCGTKELMPEQQALCLKVRLAPKPVGGCDISAKIPECLKIKCFCVSCGVQDFPDFAKDEWVTQDVLCVYQRCGPKDLLSPQALCLKCTL